LIHSSDRNERRFTPQHERENASFGVLFPGSRLGGEVFPFQHGALPANCQMPKNAREKSLDSIQGMHRDEGNCIDDD
jgi:hypothetical protein